MYYRAPEQESKVGKYDSKADLWSIGIILFEMLCPAFTTLMERDGTLMALRYS